MQFILDWFKETGYSCEAYEVEARHYGSFAHRRRLYFVAFKARAPVPGKHEYVRAMLEEPQLNMQLHLNNGMRIRQRTGSDAHSSVLI